MTDQTLWSRIKTFELDDPGVTFSFTDRVARENGWSQEYSLRTILEYKRFMYLICVSDHPLTPSDQVDQVWHLHLLYTHSYWDEFCLGVLGRSVHHGPTKGGDQERDKFDNWYERTQDLYKKEFSFDPPKDIWPSSEIRFTEINFVRVNLHRNWVIHRPWKKRS